MTLSLDYRIMTSNSIISYIKTLINLELMGCVTPTFGCTVNESWNLPHSVWGFALLKTFSTHISLVLKCKWLKYNQSRECKTEIKDFNSFVLLLHVSIMQQYLCWSVFLNSNLLAGKIHQIPHLIEKFRKKKKKLFFWFVNPSRFSVMVIELHDKNVPIKLIVSQGKKPSTLFYCCIYTLLQEEN